MGNPFGSPRKQLYLVMVGCTSIAENPRHEAIEEEEEDHRNEDIEDDVPEEESMLEGGERDGTDPLECKLGDEVLKWETMEGGV